MNAHQLAKCSKFNDVPLLDLSSWSTNFDFPIQACKYSLTIQNTLYYAVVKDFLKVYRIYIYPKLFKNKRKLF